MHVAVVFVVLFVVKQNFCMHLEAAPNIDFAEFFALILLLPRGFELLYKKLNKQLLFQKN